MGDSTLPKFMERGGLKSFARKGKDKMGEGGGGCLEIGLFWGLLYWGFCGDYSWCSIEKKPWHVYLSFVNKNVLQNNCLNTVWDCHSFNSVDSYNSCIN